ncbi:MAG: hypothetical protein JOZ41_03070 [Chloroflexi bacterium]|nr:hypothetical protein [Chloroflexota bacterium]
MPIFRRRTNVEEQVPAIAVSELKRRLDRGEDILVLDVRQPDAYRQFPAAIPGEVRIYPAELPDRFGELPRDRPIVAYCT